MIESKYSKEISDYIRTKFKNIEIINLYYKENECSFDVIIELSLNIVDTLKITIPGNSYTEYEFNCDYIKLCIFHKVRSEILSYYIEGDYNFYE